MSQETKGNGKHRVQLDFDDEMMKDLDDFVELTGSASRAEAIRRGVRFLLPVLRELRQLGKKLYMKGKDGERERLVVFF